MVHYDYAFFIFIVWYILWYIMTIYVTKMSPLWALSAYKPSGKPNEAQMSEQKMEQTCDTRVTHA